jgi:hypothetical protein
MPLSKLSLSGSTNGKAILVGTTATTIHVATASASNLDEIWLFATNITTSAVKLSIQFGGTSDTDLIEETIPPESGIKCIIPGLALGGAASLNVTALAATANAINMHGYIHRFTP